MKWYVNSKMPIRSSLVYEMTLSRRLFTGTAHLTLSNGVVRLLSIFTLPILTSLLSPQAYGVAGLVGTIISLVSVIALVGIDVSYARTYHSAQSPNGAVVEHFCWRFAILTGFVAALITGTAWWLLTRNSSELESWLGILLGLGILLAITNAMAQTRARLAGRYGRMSLAIVVSSTVIVIATIGIARWRQDALALVVSNLIGYFIPILMLGTPLLSNLMKPSGLTRDEGTDLIKIGLAGIVTAPMYWLLSSSDRWFLQYYHGVEAVGIYSIGYSIAMVGMMVNSAITSVWLPEAAREYEQDSERAKVTLGRLMSRLFAIMALIWLAVTAAGGDIIHLLANERFHTAAEFVPYIASGVLFYGISQLALYGLVLVKQFKWAALWWFLSGVVSVVLNTLLVPRYGGVGAAITQSASFAFIALSIFVTSQVKFCMQLQWYRLAIVTFIIFLSGLLMAPPWHASSPISLIMKLPIGLITAIVVSWIVAQDWCIRVITRFF